MVITLGEEGIKNYVMTDLNPLTLISYEIALIL